MKRAELKDPAPAGALTLEAYRRADAGGPAPLPDRAPRWSPAVEVLLAEVRRRRPPWVADAACRGMGPDLFYPERGEPTSLAKATCAGCPVRPECAAFAVTERFGIWGGMSDRERRRARRGRAA